MRAAHLSAILAIAVLAYACKGREVAPAEQQEEVKAVHIYGFEPSEYVCDSITVKSGETFGGLLTRLGMSGNDAYALTRNCPDSVFNVRKFRAGNALEAFYSPDSSARRLEYLVYHQNLVRTTVFHCTDSLYAHNVDKPTVKERRYTDVTIRESLWNDMIHAGASPMLISELADIYQWSVNFFGLQEGDRFRTIYTQTLCEGQVFKIDTIHFSIFNSGSHEVPALRYDIGKGSTYWGKEGESLKKMFLKAPLKYNRISSRFTYARKHPITGKVRPHTAVDYAAPTGTPVHSIGEGKVTACGWDGSGGGNRIRIKHMQGYESCYMHLSRFASGIRVGSVVHQGQLIGYVGSTGHSTGPHLDFRIWQNGKPINPLTLDSPSAEPLAASYRAGFDSLYVRYMKEISAYGN